MKGVQAFEAEDYSKAYEELAPLAVRGNPEAQFYVAKMHHLGLGIPKNLNIAFMRYKDSAEQGFMEAQHNLGIMFIDGLSTNVNPELGFDWIAKAAEQGLAVSQYTMGMALTADSPLQLDITRGIEYLEAAALQNHAKALTMLGEHFSFREIDYSKSFDYFEKGAALGEPHAMYRLSYVYMHGTLKAKDQEKAHYLLKASAEKKYLPSYYDLAMSYLWGNGIKQSFEKGIEWMKKSAIEANNHNAMEALAQILLEHRSSYLTKVNDLDDIKSGIEWRIKAATMDNASSQFNLFVQYYNGDYVPSSKTEAIKWLKASAKNGHIEGQNELGRQYINGWDVPKDYKKAFSLYKRAATKEHSAAIKAVGASYIEGLGVEKNATLALKWLKKLPDEESAFLIGKVYMDGGIGVAQNRSLAEEWFRKSNEPLAMTLIPFLYLNDEYGIVNIEKGLSLAKEIMPSLAGEFRNMIQGALMRAYDKKNNLKEKFYWLNKLSDSGDTQFQALLGMYLVSGNGIQKDIDRGIELITKAAINNNADAQYYLGLIYFIGSQEAGLGNYIEVDREKSLYWLSMLTEQGGPRADEFIIALKENIIEEKKLAVRNQQLNRLEKATQFKKSEEEKLTSVKQLAEYKQQSPQQEQQSSPSLLENFIGDLFEAVLDGAVMYGQAKINKELGIKSTHERQLDDFRKVVDEENKKMLRQLRKDRRMNQIMKNLQTRPSIGYTVD